MALVLTIGGVTQTAYIQEGTATLKFNTFDVTLVDPATIPANGDAVALTTPTWNGTVSSVQRRPGPRIGHDYCTVTATNTDIAGASAGPWGLSDTPNGSTTYGYEFLDVQVSVNLDGTVTTNGTCTLYQTGLWPAMTFNLTNADLGYSAQSFSVQDMVVTWVKGVPRYQMTFGDPIVTMSVWINSAASGTITTTKITDGSVTTPKLAAGSVTADKLTATLILATLIASSASGARWEADSDGIRLFDASDGLLVNIPTDGSPVYVAGQLDATSLVSTGTAEFQGTTSFATPSVTTLQAGVQAPSSAPTLGKGWASHTPAAPSVPSAGYSFASISAGHYDATGGAGGATPCFIAVVLWTKTANPDIVEVIEWKIADWSVDRRTTLTGLTKGTDWYPSPSQMGVTRLGTSWYIGALDNGGTGTNRVSKITRSTGAQSATATRVTTEFWDITNDGTNLLLFLYDSVPTCKVETWTTAPAFSASKTITGFPTGGTVSGPNGIEYDGTNWWLAFGFYSGGLFSARAYKATIATGAVVANSDFPLPWAGDYQSLYWDGTIFHSGTGSSISGGFTITDHTSWDWTTASAIYWVAYAWYDSAGTTHETVVGPRQSITMGRRQQLTVGNAAIPVGGADDPDKVRVYMAPNATDPGAGAFKLQATDALTTRTLTTYNSGGAADGAGTAFPGGVGGTISSAGSGWILRGNGSMNLGGASFPASPATNDAYFRTDKGLLFTYDGTRWLSADLFIAKMDQATNLSVTTSIYGVPTPQEGTDVYLVDHVVQFFINGGTALSGSHKWVGVLQKVDSSNANTTVDTTTINSGASSTWRTVKVALNALLTSATYLVMRDTWTITGTPGNLYAMEYVSYRIVAT